MPFEFTCRDHPDFLGAHVDAVLIHIGAEHPRSVADRLTRDGTIRGRFYTQLEARGEASLRLFACRVCGCMVETIDTVRANDAYCDDHRKVPTG